MLKSLENNAPQIDVNSYIDESAQVIGNVRAAGCVSVWPGAVVRADLAPIALGEYTNIQDNCVLHVDQDQPLTVGARVTVGHGAILHSCTIGNDVLIGMGAILLDGAVIGDGAMVAAGAVVAPGTQVPPRAVVMGVPARSSREVTAEEAAQNAANNQKYWALAQRYIYDAIPSDM